jgi:phosphomethylpyrimidine synthase
VELAMDRVCGMVSRGGTILAQWMTAHGKENPLLTGYDRLLDIARRGG